MTGAVVVIGLFVLIGFIVKQLLDFKKGQRK